MTSLALNRLLMEILGVQRRSMRLTATISLLMVWIIVRRTMTLAIILLLWFAAQESQIMHSKELIVEGDVGVVLLVVHHVPEALDGHGDTDPVDVVFVPFVVVLAEGLEVIVALGQVVAGDVGVEVVDVVVFDAAAEQLEEKSEGEVGAALQSGAGVAPLLGPCPVAHVDRVLHVEEKGSKHLRQVVEDPESHRGDSEGRQDPNEQHKGQNFFEEGQAEYSISLGDDIVEMEEPDEGDGDEEVDDWFSEQPHEYFFHAFHFVILLFCEEDGLGDIRPVQVSVVLVVVVVAVPPSVEGEVAVYPQYFPDDGVHGHGLEEREMGHVMELYEPSDGEEDLAEPSNHSQTHLDEKNDDDLLGN